MKRYALFMAVATVAAVLGAPSARAQQDNDAPEAPKKAPKELIIKRLDNDGKKTVIVIEDGKVTVNGKPAGDQVIVIPDRPGKEDLRKIQLDIRDADIDMAMRKADLEVRKDDMARVMKDVRIKMLDVRDAMGASVRLGVYTKENEKGAEVVRVDDSSAAFKAGLKTGDIIVKLDDSPITDPEALSKVVHSHKPDEQITLTYLRNGKEEKTKATLQKIQPMIIKDLTFAPGQFDGDAFRDFGDKIRIMGRRPRLGAHIQDMEDSTGVKVLQVDPESPAATAGLQKDDVITAIDGQTINGTDKALEALKGTEEKHAYTVTVNRGGQTMTLQVKIPHDLKSATL